MFSSAGRYPAAYAAWLGTKAKWKADATVARDQYMAEREELSRKFKLDALEEVFETRVDELYKIGDRILATPANSLEGILVKLRAADQMDCNHAADNNALIAIAADIRRLAGVAT